ncbi:glycoside hydrolase family 31 [Moniliophthora roreri MCA 2997]|uniref:Glycoside hydrolase family 31 n=1 Tax=Moniliophthora roreri (strain MCA 2997) TaxID=1381753 RepID=V2YGH2_MONRO|nr:glycoside hydrolase family 31 [Moniliophthora roreri MCA 2997]
MSTLLLWGVVTVLGSVVAADYFQPNSTGVKLQNGYERVYIQPFGNHAFRVRASIMRDPTGNEWSALLDPPLEGPGGNQGLNHDTTLPYQSSFTIRNGDLAANIQNGTISFHRVEGNGTTTLLTGEYVDTKTLLPRYYFQDFRSSGFEAWFSFSSEEDEQFYGTGQQACCNDHSVNKKGQVVDLMNYNSHVTMPVYMSNKGYLQYFNMPGQGRIEFGHQRTRFVASEATVVDYWITTAPPGDYDALQQQFTAVTGRQPTPPDFALGYQQSKLRYYNQTQVEDLAQRFHDEQVNISLIVIDFFAWKFQGDWSFDESVWPDPAAMAKRVKDLTGAELMVSLWPSVEDKSVNYLTLQHGGLLATTRDGTGIHDSFEGVYTRLVDSTNPEAREFLWKRLNDSYFSKGIHNFWIDQADGGTLGEPYQNNGQDLIRGIPYSRTFAQYFIGTQEASGKLYPWFHQQAIDEGFQNLTSSGPGLPTSCQYLSLTRSTFVGGQRFCSYLWSGDTDSRFDVLLQQVTAGVSVAASGISAWTLDIGGFAGLNIDTEEGKELFVRWFALGTFLPFMRVHGYAHLATIPTVLRISYALSTRSCNAPRTSTLPHANPCPNEPWSYGDDNFVVTKKYIALRYQLIPYIKKLFQDLQATGKSIMRPLYHDFSSSDPFVANATRFNEPAIVHQFMLGQRLLVAPVGELGVTAKEVYLPVVSDKLGVSGATWKHWWTDEDFGSGGKFVNVSAPLDAIPVFYLGSKADILNGSV